jgi:hypothetical protein
MLAYVASPPSYKDSMSRYRMTAYVLVLTLSDIVRLR